MEYLGHTYTKKICCSAWNSNVTGHLVFYWTSLDSAPVPLPKLRLVVTPFLGLPIILLPSFPAPVLPLLCMGSLNPQKASSVD